MTKDRVYSPHEFVKVEIDPPNKRKLVKQIDKVLQDNLKSEKEKDHFYMILRKLNRAKKDIISLTIKQSETVKQLLA